jgi:hypothetical protein
MCVVRLGSLCLALALRCVTLALRMLAALSSSMAQALYNATQARFVRLTMCCLAPLQLHVKLSAK